MNNHHTANLGQELLPIKGGFSQHTVSSTAFVIADEIDLDKINPHYVDITIEVSNLRYRGDNSAPTDSIGKLLYAGKTYRVNKAEAKQAQLILDAAAGGDATIQLQTMNRPTSL